MSLGRFVFDPSPSPRSSEPLTGRPHEPLTLDLRIGFSVPSQSDEPRVYDQGPDVPGLFQMWQGI
jgi:hypothetical protein